MREPIEPDRDEQIGDDERAANRRSSEMRALHMTIVMTAAAAALAGCKRPESAGGPGASDPTGTSMPTGSAAGDVALDTMPSGGPSTNGAIASGTAGTLGTTNAAMTPPVVPLGATSRSTFGVLPSTQPQPSPFTIDGVTEGSRLDSTTSNVRCCGSPFTTLPAPSTAQQPAPGMAQPRATSSGVQRTPPGAPPGKP